MAESLKTVDPDSGAGYDYASLFDWEAAQQADIDASNTIAVARCRCTGGTADTTSVVIDGWTTASGDYIKIWTDPTETYRHNGTYETGNHYRLEKTNGSGIITVESYVRFYGIQVQLTIANNSTAEYTGLGNTATGTVAILFDSCIVKSVISGTNSKSCYGFNNQNNASGVVFQNCLAYDFINGTEAHAGIRSNNGTNVAYNCTVQNTYRGFRLGSGTFTATNCGAAGCTTGFTAGLTQVTCSSTTPTFVDEASDNFHLAAADTTWAGAGTDLSANFTWDIDGQTRPTGASTWDIGADEYVSSVSSAVPVLMDSYRFRRL